MGDLKDLLGIGLEAKQLSVLNVCARALIVFLAAVIMVRLADRRFLGKMTPFDVIMGFVLGSMLSRAINGSSAFVPTLAGAFALVLLHRLLAIASFHSHTFGVIVKGQEQTLVRDGKIDETKMRHFQLTEHDLLEAARLKGKINSAHEIRLATFERNGQISVIPREA